MENGLNKSNVNGKHMRNMEREWNTDSTNGTQMERRFKKEQQVNDITSDSPRKPIWEFIGNNGQLDFFVC